MQGYTNRCLRMFILILRLSKVRPVCVQPLAFQYIDLRIEGAEWFCLPSGLSRIICIYFRDAWRITLEVGRALQVLNTCNLHSILQRGRTKHDHCPSNILLLMIPDRPHHYSGSQSLPPPSPPPPPPPSSIIL